MKTITYIFVLGIVLAPFSVSAPAAENGDAISLENDFMIYQLSPNGQNLHFIDKRSGKDYFNHAGNIAFARVRIKDQIHPSTGIAYDGALMTVSFENVDFQAALRIEKMNSYIIVKVESVKGSPVDELVFFDAALLPGDGDDPFAGCALALNLQTNVLELPQANTLLRAACYPRFGMEGAEVAVIGCPQSKLRGVMKEVVSQAKDLPHSTIGGPWALDAELSRGSYLFNFDGMTEESVEQWIALAQSMGVTQIDFHGGSSFRFGDCEPNPKTFPNGKASFKKIIDRLHAAGISAGLHTYAFFIDKKCPWVTPVPDPRLAKDAVFTLSADLPLDATTIPVAESTKDMSTITGFFVRNGVTLQIDDELIVYRSINKEPPYAFTNCQRGAYGTKAAAHSSNSKVSHLKECFGLFVPDPDTMLTDVAAKTAEMFNECGFDMIYLDALDGEDILGGGENAWHYGSKFVFDIFSRLKKSPLMEMSTFHHHLWYVRSRMGAWDQPNRGSKRFLDFHSEANKSLQQMFLPGLLGWWRIRTWSGIQEEPTFSDEIEYLCGKCIGYGAGFAMMGIDPSKMKIPAYQRLSAIMKQYEELRHANYFDESIKTKLRVPGSEFTLFQDEEKRWRLKPASYSVYKMEGFADGRNIWEAANPYSAQPLKLRIESLMSAQPYDYSDSIPLVDFSNPNELSDRMTAEGVQFQISDSTGELSVDRRRSGSLTATNKGALKPKDAWTKAGKVFSPPFNMSNKEAVGLYVYGDGQGEILNLQLRSPEHITSSIGDHYIPIDFTGWRYFELIELESERYSNYGWPYGNLYSIYRENLQFNQIESISLWLTNLPPNQSVNCRVSAIKGLPLVTIKIKNPSFTIGGKKLTFPVELESGQYLEFYSLEDCKWYGADGGLLGEIKPTGEVPELAKGANRIQFGCDSPAEFSPRARVTVITQGDAM